MRESGKNFIFMYISDLIISLFSIYLERGQEGHVDALNLISMGAPEKYMAGPPVKLRQSRYLHFSKVQDGRLG